jgi:hypothetical protein
MFSIKFYDFILTTDDITEILLKVALSILLTADFNKADIMFIRGVVVVVNVW